MNSSPLISVIIPVYNVEKYLRRCLDSVIGQTYKNLDIILIDDGSSDNSGNICDEYAARDGRISVIHQENQGVSAARNRGLDTMKGEYVAFVDSDDYVDSILFEKAVGVICSYWPDIIDYGINFVDKDGDSHINWHCSQRKEAIFNREHIVQNILPELVHVKPQTNDNIAAWVTNKLFNSNIINNHSIRFDTEIRIWEDGIFTVEALKYSYSYISLYGFYYNYRDTQNSLSERHDEKIFSYVETIYKKYLDLFENEYDFNCLSSLEYRFKLIHGMIIREFQCLYNKKADKKSIKKTILDGLRSKTIKEYYCGLNHKKFFFKVVQSTIRANLLNLVVLEYFFYFNICRVLKK